MLKKNIAIAMMLLMLQTPSANCEVAPIKPIIPSLQSSQ